MNLDALQSFFSEGEPEGIDKVKEHSKQPLNPILTAHIERDKQNQELYFKMADNTRKSERLRAKITKGIKSGMEVDEVLTMALECISIMTGDILFYQQNIKELSKR